MCGKYVVCGYGKAAIQQYACMYACVYAQWFHVQECRKYTVCGYGKAATKRYVRVYLCMYLSMYVWFTCVCMYVSMHVYIHSGFLSGSLQCAATARLLQSGAYAIYTHIHKYALAGAKFWNLELQVSHGCFMHTYTHTSWSPVLEPGHAYGLQASDEYVRIHIHTYIKKHTHTLAGAKFWDLGMPLDYKLQMGALCVRREAYLQRLAEVRDITPLHLPRGRFPAKNWM
jgi:hypothetical protein